MTDFLGYMAAGEPAAPPTEYYEMVILPARGWAYRDVRALSLSERAVLFRMLDIEARCAPPPPRR